MKVSAIIPFYRHAACIERAVDSVWKQTVRPEETIIVNDGSTSAGSSALKRLAHTYEGLKIVDLDTNMGPGKARNVGWDFARGDYLAFLDADDTWHPQKTAVQLEWFRRHPDAHLICGESVFIQSASQVERDIAPCSCYQLRPIDLLLHNPVSTRTVMLRKDIDLRFAEHKRNSEDYQLYLTAVLKDFKFYFCQARLAYCFKSEFGDGGLSARLAPAHRGHVDTLRRIRIQGLMPPHLYLTLRLLAQLKYYRRRLFVRLGINRRTKPMGLALKPYIPFFRFK